MFWKENARHNGTEEPGHQPIVPYDDRLGVARGKDLSTWRTNGIDFVGTQEGLAERTEASKRVATVDVEAVQKGDVEEEQKRNKKTCRATKYANQSKAGGNQPRSELYTEPGARPTHSFRRRDKSNQKEERHTKRRWNKRAAGNDLQQRQM